MVVENIVIEVEIGGERALHEVPDREETHRPGQDRRIRGTGLESQAGRLHGGGEIPGGFLGKPDVRFIPELPGVDLVPIPFRRAPAEPVDGEEIVRNVGRRHGVVVGTILIARPAGGVAETAGNFHPGLMEQREVVVEKLPVHLSRNRFDALPVEKLPRVGETALAEQTADRLPAGGRQVRVAGCRVGEIGLIGVERERGCGGARRRRRPRLHCESQSRGLIAVPADPVVAGLQLREFQLRSGEGAVADGLSPPVGDPVCGSGRNRAFHFEANVVRRKPAGRRGGCRFQKHLLRRQREGESE